MSNGQIASIKENLPILFLLDQHDVAVVESSGKYTAVCPLHSDSTPSFSVFGEGLKRWSCFAGCGAGDVLDLLGAFEPELLDGGTKVTRALLDRAELLIVLKDNLGWTEPTTSTVRRELNPVTVAERVKHAQDNVDLSVIDQFIAHKREQCGGAGWNFDSEWLVDNFGVGTDSGELIIPVYTAGDKLLTYKYWRNPNEKRMVASDTVYGQTLYNEWVPLRSDFDIILCAGESDTWNAAALLGDGWDVRGVLAGETANPVGYDTWLGKRVLLCFDGDGPGRKGARKWAAALDKAGINSLIVPMPEGKDLSSCGNIRQLIAEAKPVLSPPSGITETATGYKFRNDLASNWIFTPERVLFYENQSVFEGKLMPGGIETILKPDDLTSKNRVVAWASKHSRAWYGSDRDASVLLAKLQAESAFLPSGNLATITGLHNNHFVFPEETIGSDVWKYHPPRSDVHWEGKINLYKSGFEPKMVNLMRKIKPNHITDPILAWLAIAPLRSILPYFPALQITGGAGSGKSTSTSAMIKAFSGSSYLMTLSRTSPYVVGAVMSSTNAYPVMVDEVRKGAREDTRMAFNQLLRDTYTMQESQLGGLKGHFAEVSSVRPTAPIVVAGEDTFVEESHIDRMIMLYFTKEGNKEAYQKLESLGETGFARVYLTWLQHQLAEGHINISPQPIASPDLSVRQQNNLAVLHLGWEILQTFLEHYGVELSEPDFSHVIDRMRAASKRTPIEDALLYCLGESDAKFIWRMTNSEDVNEIWLRPENFIAFVSDPRRAAVFPMPGGARAIEDYIIDRFGARESIVDKNGLRRRFMVFPYDRISK